MRQHPLDIVRLPAEHADEGYHSYTLPSHIAAIMQLLEWGDQRLVPALEEIARHPELEHIRADTEETIMLVRTRLGLRDFPGYPSTSGDGEILNLPSVAPRATQSNPRGR